jgi:hypothetical protein
MARRQTRRKIIAVEDRSRRIAACRFASWCSPLRLESLCLEKLCHENKKSRDINDGGREGNARWATHDNDAFFPPRIKMNSSSRLSSRLRVFAVLAERLFLLLTK